MYNTLLFLFAVILFYSCEKENPKQADSQNAANSSSSAFLKPESTNNQTVPGGTANACTLSGTYVGTVVGTSPANNGITLSTVHRFKENNFITAGSTVASPDATWGGYRVTCDSVIMSTYHITNGGTYLHKGKFSNNRNTISGTWVNLNNPSVDYGNFTVTKQ